MSTDPTTNILHGVSPADRLAVAATMLQRAADQVRCFFDSAPEQPYLSAEINRLIDAALAIQETAIQEVREHAQVLRVVAIERVSAKATEKGADKI